MAIILNSVAGGITLASKGTQGSSSGPDKLPLDGSEPMAGDLDMAGNTLLNADVATATQGALAESALQNGDNISELINDEGYTSRLNVTQRLVNTASPSAILSTDGTILFDSALVIISIDLPLASVGKVKIPFKDSGCNSSTNNITVNRAGSDTITDSATSQASTTIASNGFSGYFLSDGVDTWYLL